MVVEPVLRIGVEVEVDDREAGARAEVLPVAALVVVHALPGALLGLVLAQECGQDRGGAQSIEVAVVVDAEGVHLERGRGCVAGRAGPAAPGE